MLSFTGASPASPVPVPTHTPRGLKRRPRGGLTIVSLPRGTVRSPNIWEHPAVYELENRAVDRDGRIERAMREVADWGGREVLDLGCGSGFHLPRFADTASRVYGVEPHPGLLRLASRRTRSLDNGSLLGGA